MDAGLAETAAKEPDAGDAGAAPAPSVTVRRRGRGVRFALRFGAGFVLAAALLGFVELVLAVYPDPLLMAALVAPPAIVAAVALDTLRRRRAASRRRARR